MGLCSVWNPVEFRVRGGVVSGTMLGGSAVAGTGSGGL